MTDRLREPGTWSLEPRWRTRLASCCAWLTAPTSRSLRSSTTRRRFRIRRDLSGGRPHGAASRSTVPRLRPSQRGIVDHVAGRRDLSTRRSARPRAGAGRGRGVAAGQVVGAVEAMGMLNRIQSERAGVVQEMLVREGQPVEYGQPLLVLREP